jgi:hypothetical protein
MDPHHRAAGGFAKRVISELPPVAPARITTIRQQNQLNCAIDLASLNGCSSVRPQSTPSELPFFG